MKKFFISLISLSFAVFTFTSCKPDPEPEPEPQPEEVVFVSKTPESRNVLLEEYTGVNCG